MDLMLGGKVALVSGSSRGTGEGIARVLAREGATVLVHGFEADAAEAVAAKLRAEGGSAHAIPGNLLCDEAARRCIESAEQAAGPIDVLVNNYGTAAPGSWLDDDTESWLDMYQRNVLSGVRLVRHVCEPMRERGWGRILFIGTVGSLRPAARMPGYYAAKAALANMTLSLSKELAGSGVTVNCVSPGLIATREVRAQFTRLAERRGLSTDWPTVSKWLCEDFMPNTTGLVTEVEEVGDLIAFLASDRARNINGANLRIDGGAADCVN